MLKQIKARNIFEYTKWYPTRVCNLAKKKVMVFHIFRLIL